MLGGDKILDEEQKNQYDDAIDEFYQRALNQVPNILARIPDQRLQETVYQKAFSPDSDLSERIERPHLTAAYYVENLYLDLADDPVHADELLQLTLVLQEYYDILDDIVDDDLDAEGTTSATIVTQALYPVSVQLLDELPDASAQYWSERAIRLAESWSLEQTTTPSQEEYRTLLERQSNLYGFVTGLAALSAGADIDRIQQAEQLGRAVFKLDATWLDLIQHKLDLDPDWNIYELYEPDAVAELLIRWQSNAERQVDALADERAFLLRTPLEEEFEQWYDKYPRDESMERGLLPT